MEFNLDGLRMHAVQTAPNGAVSRDTIFRFSQTDDRVWATYDGGQIDHGYLVGTIRGTQFEFRYCQMQRDGTLDGGHSRCQLKVGAESRIQIIERFQWTSRAGGGTNIIQEMAPIDRDV